MMRWILTFVLILNGLVYWWYQQNTGKAESLSSASSSQVKPLVGDSTEPVLLLSERKAAPAIKPSAGAPLAPVAEIPESKELVDPAIVVDNGDQQSRQDKNNDQLMVCGLIGPFSDKVTARQVQNRLKVLDISGDIRKEEIEVDPIYWVYLPPRANRKQALAMLRELQSKKIDAFMIAEGEQKFGISLGFFKQQASAEDFQKLRTQQGYPAQLLKKNKKKDMYWFVLQPAEITKISDPLFQKLKADFPLLQKQQNLCSRVASLGYIE